MENGIQELRDDIEISVYKISGCTMYTDNIIPVKKIDCIYIESEYSNYSQCSLYEIIVMIGNTKNCIFSGKNGEISYGILEKIKKLYTKCVEKNEVLLF